MLVKIERKYICGKQVPCGGEYIYRVVVQGRDVTGWVFRKTLKAWTTLNIVEVDV